MIKRQKLMSCFLVLISICAICLYPAPAYAQGTPASTQYGNITAFGTCWSAECIIVATDAPYVDNGCGGTATAQYATAPGAAGNTVIHATLFSALLSGKKVSLVVQGCIFGHPQIIGVGVQI